VQVVAVLDACYRSAAAGEVVRLAGAGGAAATDSGASEGATGERR